jgi:hypothetical protein
MVAWHEARCGSIWGRHRGWAQPAPCSGRANIVENALKYAPDSEIVIVGSVGGTGSATIEGFPASELRIIDHGKGVPADQVVTMFKPFQRLDDAPAGTGIGLGLAVAKGFTEAMGGRLLAEETPGGGLTMIIRLPLSTGGPDQAPSEFRKKRLREHQETVETRGTGLRPAFP